MTHEANSCEITCETTLVSLRFRRVLSSKKEVVVYPLSHIRQRRTDRIVQCFRLLHISRVHYHRDRSIYVKQIVHVQAPAEARFSKDFRFSAF